ncbi:MAG: potassium transporter [Alphaproteobacteria bacterium CG_4_10_14_0_2_um_filter_63_37]|nr:MAG: potassium transporter [Alphaproteobacteria bacterium CG_4_10_14_0_2_um_filter_63_37]
MESVLSQLLLIFAIAVVIVLTSRRVGVSPVVGYILTGMLIGPSVLGWVDSRHDVELLSEFGIVLLLFTIGLEFSVETMMAMRRLVFGVGSFQVLATVLAVSGLAWLLGVDAATAVTIGFVASLSSTAIVLKLLMERGEVESPYGRLAVGVLLFQDLAVVPMMIALPLLGGETADLGQTVALAVGKGVAAVVLVFLAGRYLLSPLLTHVARSRSSELFIITVMVVCFGTAWLTNTLGLSMALGAFLAGMMVAETQFHHQVHADIAPFRDLFLSLFFISVGMLVDLPALGQWWWVVIVVVMALGLLKAVVVGAGGRLAGGRWETGLLAGIALGQIGEFSLVLILEAQNHELLPDPLGQWLLGATVLSMAMTPPIIAMAPKWIDRMPWFRITGRMLRDETLAELARDARTYEGHVLICGYGVLGQTLARVLRKDYIPYVILELNTDTVKQARMAGEPIYYGDASHRDILKAARVFSARAMVVAVPDLAAAERTVAVARNLNPTMELVVRTKYVRSVQRLKDAGANIVVPEEFEATLEIARRLLLRMGIDRVRIARHVRQIRERGYSDFLGIIGAEAWGDSTMTIGEDPGEQIEPVTLGGDDFAVGKNLAELALRSKLPVSIERILRDQAEIPMPGGGQRLQAGDVVVLFGPVADVVKAIVYLRKGIDPV